MREMREELANERMDSGAERILVSVRLRPLNSKEIARNDASDWECINENTIIFKNSLPERSMLPSAYTFDRVFCCDCSTKQAYEEAAKAVALSVLSGINSSIFAYGQTSSGKTFTMTGITEYTLADIFNFIQKHEERAFFMKFSAIEIYNEAVRDLLSADATPLRLLDDPERGTIVERLTEETVRDWDHLKELLSICEAQRQIGETSLNETSSRSHQILRLTIESSAREFLGRENSSTLIASVNFVDLAGSERASQTLSAGTRLKEGCHINRSLLTLGTVIRKLSKGRNGHIPYRDSKLTRILQSSLGGNARTAIICTMSPARSHIEQSRNTLSFATCAKEVATSAKVNVVMSDKALVTQLQKELARLESELSGIRSTSATSHSEAILMEKDVQIQKTVERIKQAEVCLFTQMEKEMEELIQQRDFAHSRLEGLLQVLGDDQASRHWAEFSQPPRAHSPNFCEDELSLSDSSGTADRSLYHGLSNFIVDQRSTEYCGTHCNGHFLEISEIPGNQSFSGSTSPRHSITSPRFVASVSQQSGKDTSYVTNDDFEDLCKEVRCIEIEESSIGRNEEANAFSPEGNKSLPSSTVSDNLHASDQELESIANEDRDLKIDSTNDNSDEKIQDVQIPISQSSPWIMSEDLSSPENLCSNRSGSCRGILMTGSSSPGLQAAGEPNENMPPTAYDENFSQISEHSASSDMLKTQHIKTASEMNYNFVVELKEMAKLQCQEKLGDDLEAKPKVTKDFATEKTKKDVGLDPMLTPSQSPSTWPLEFERQRREIIELWNACNVSLVHRTYFFLLFKGDPADSIYMEVELRRLSFLKNMFSQEEKLRKPAVEDCRIFTNASSMKALRREREMLSKQMQKIFPEKERESLYQKWGIGLETKQRKLQLAHRLWTETRDMDHIRESAAIVAKIIGFLDQGQALKEMFSLSFTPQLAGGKAFSWKNSKSCYFGTAYL